MNKKIFLAGLLCLASVATVVGTVGNAHKVEAADMKTIYLDNSAGKLTKTYIYTWSWGGTSDAASTLMSDEDGDGIYDTEIPADRTHIIFTSSGSVTNIWDSNQTSDITLPTDESNMYTLTSLNSGTWSVKGVDIDANQIVSQYYNLGIYTKSTKIHLNDSGKTEFSKYFHGDVALDRTTYFTKDALWMTNYNGNITVGSGINSGYGTDENGNLTHFTVDKTGKKVNEKYSANKEHKNWDDKTLDGMEGFYVTLHDLSTGIYFDNSWKNTSGFIFEHTVTNKNTDAYLVDFLAIAAPCLTDKVAESNYYDVEKLVISENEGLLKLEIVLDSGCQGYVDNEDCILATAEIKKGHIKTYYFVDQYSWIGYDQTPYVHMWKDGGAGTSWPGAVSTHHLWDGSKNTYKIDVDLNAYEKMIWNNNNNKQTADLDLNLEHNYCKPTSNTKGTNVSWYSE